MTNEDASSETRAFVEGIGGRLSEPKSLSYRRALSDIERRSNKYLLKYAYISDIAYVMSGIDGGLIPQDDGCDVLQSLYDLLIDIDHLIGREDQVDVITQREQWVAERIGTEKSSYLHTGRNRGESLKGYLPKMFLRRENYEQRIALVRLLEALLERAEEHRATIAPVYHHMQHAGVTVLAEYLLSWAGSLQAHCERLRQIDERLDVAPPPISDRAVVRSHALRVQAHLGFQRAAALRHEVHLPEDHFIEPLFGAVAVNVSLARMAEDLRLWMTAEFDLFSLHDSHASTSSALPQKKNPFGLQAVIGGAAIGGGRLAGQLAASATVPEGLASAFHAGSLYEYVTDVVAWTHYMSDVVRLGRFNVNQLLDKATLGAALASEACEILVYEELVPTRMAHHAMGMLVRARVDGLPIPDVVDNLQAELGRTLNVSLDSLLALIDGEQIPAEAVMSSSVEAAFVRLRHQIDAEGQYVEGRNPIDQTVDDVLAKCRQRIADPCA